LRPASKLVTLYRKVAVLVVGKRTTDYTAVLAPRFLGLVVKRMKPPPWLPYALPACFHFLGKELASRVQNAVLRQTYHIIHVIIFEPVHHFGFGMVAICAEHDFHLRPDLAHQAHPALDDTDDLCLCKRIAWTNYRCICLLACARVVIRVAYVELALPDWKAEVIDNGYDAILQIGLLQSRIVLLDIMMPQIDGIKVFQRLRENARLAEIVVMFVTATTDERLLDRARAAGAFALVQKPVKRDQMTVLLQSAAAVRA